MRGLSGKTIELILFARILLQQLHPMTLRQLHYAIFSAAVIAYLNTQADYKRLSRATTYARRLYRDCERTGTPMPGHVIPPDWMVDELREAERVSMWDDAAAYLQAVKHSYRRDMWPDQPRYCEVWSEKATVLNTMRPVTKEYGVMLRVCRGFGSTGMESQIGKLFEDVEQPITVFYLGDHDPSGHCIEHDIHMRAQTWSGREFDMVRLAIHPADIAAFNLPPQRIKTTDSRARGFEKRFGAGASTVELDALPVDELRQRVRSAIEGLIDFDSWNRQVEIQNVELACIREFADRVKNLPQAHG